MSFGETLRTAREAKGLSAKQIAESTHLLVQVVEGLENEDFRRIPAAIYGRGFVKLYCEAVGLEPKPLQAEFMALYSANRDAPAKMPPPPSPNLPPKAEPPTASISDTSAGNDQPPAVSAAAKAEPYAEQTHSLDDLFSQPTAHPAAPSPIVEAEPPKSQKPTEPAASSTLPPLRTHPADTAAPPRRSYGDIFGQSYASEEPGRPSAAEKFRETMSNVSAGVFSNVKKLPPNSGRIATLAVASAIVAIMIGWGVTALYRATTPQPDADTPPAASATATATKPKAADDGKADKAKADKAKAETKKTSTQSAGNPSTKKIPAAKPGKLKSTGIDVPSLYID